MVADGLTKALDALVTNNVKSIFDRVTYCGNKFYIVLSEFRSHFRKLRLLIYRKYTKPKCMKAMQPTDKG